MGETKEIEQLLQNQLNIRKLVKPIIDAIHEKPLPYEIMFIGQYPPIAGGFQNTFQLAPQVLSNVSPTMYEKYLQLQREGGFGISVIYSDNKTNIENGHITTEILNNPAMLDIIAHELAHSMQTKPTSLHAPLRETLSVTAEILAQHALKKHGIYAYETSNSLFELMKYSNDIDAVETICNMVEEMEMPFTDAINKCNADIINDYRTFLKRTVPADELPETKKPFAEANFYKCWHSLPPNKLEPSAPFQVVPGKFSGCYAFGTIFGVILANKIKNNELKFDDVITVFNNKEKDDIEKLAMLGIAQITQKHIDDMYKFADEQVEAYKTVWMNKAPKPKIQQKPAVPNDREI